MINKKNAIISTLIFLSVIGLTYYIIFSNNNISDMLNSIKLIDNKYIIISVILVTLYFILQGFFTKGILKTLNVNIPVKKGVFYAIVEFFFSALTPGSAGGQPLVMYYMSKDNINIKKSSILMLTATIIFKLYIIVGSILILIFYPNIVFENGKLITLLFFIGIFCDSFLITLYLLLMYNKTIIKALLKLFYKIKIKFTKREFNIDEQIKDVLKQYSEDAKFIKNHKLDLLKGIIITFIQRTIFFSVSFVIYKSYGLNGTSYFEFLFLQILLQTCLESIFIPGAAGANEFITNGLFITYFGSLATTSMIVVRTLTFHIPLMIITLIIIFVTKFKYKNII